MNNPVTIVANDPTPLRGSPTALNALNEWGNVFEWIENEFTQYTPSSSLSQADIAHKVQVLMGNKLVAKTHNRMIENTYGLIFHHSLTEEPIGEDFHLLYVYKVDRTDASAESYLPQTGPMVNIMDIERKISPPAPHGVSISIKKTLFQKFMLSLKLVAGAWLKHKNERMAMGLPENFDLDDPKLLITAVEYENFMSHMDLRLAAAANALTRGANTNALFKIIRQAPSIYSLTKNKHFRNVIQNM